MAGHAVLDPNTGKVLDYRALLHHPTLGEAWNLLAANVFGRLAQGVGGRIKGTNTIFFKNGKQIRSQQDANRRMHALFATSAYTKRNPIGQG